MFASKSQVKKFHRSLDGVTAVEFAILAPVFLLFILGIIEFSRAIWTGQTIEDAAYFGARCAAIGLPQCSDETSIINEVTKEANSLGIAIAPSSTSVSLNVDCHGAQSHKVNVSYALNSPFAGYVKALPKDIKVEVCYPVGDP